jgi:hypothetical protein
MKISKEGILTQLGYPVNEGTLKELNIIEKNTPGFENIKNHILALNDHIKQLEGHIAMSSSKPYFKIKIVTSQKSILEEATQYILKWAKKYNVNLEKVKDRETYYIKGIQ